MYNNRNNESRELCMVITYTLYHSLYIIHTYSNAEFGSSSAHTSMLVY